VTLSGYCLALSILLGSLVLLAAVFYALLRLQRRRKPPALRGQEL
jgi:hypothetical protein